VGVGGWEEEGE